MQAVEQQVRTPLVHRVSATFSQRDLAALLAKAANDETRRAPTCPCSPRAACSVLERTSPGSAVYSIRQLQSVNDIRALRGRCTTDADSERRSLRLRDGTR